jgi:tetratricopeptide (TPR) repeat protein
LHLFKEGNGNMPDLKNPPCFDRFQQLVLWLSNSMYGHRRGRHYLESNPALLESEAGRELARLIEAEAEENPEMKQQMHHHQLLLQDIQRRGGTVAAIRASYVNAYGGLTLDIPPWLEEIEQHRQFLNRLRRPERTGRADISLLQTALALAAYAPELPTEIVAELHNELGIALLQGAYQQTHEARVQALQQAVTSHKVALTVYTLKHYPLQYAKTQMHLGAAYLQHTLAGQSDETEQAIACYNEAAMVYTPDILAEQWLQLQTSLGMAYLQRTADDPADNREQAIAYHRIALQHALSINIPTIWATIQVNLGDAYRQRIIGVRNQNLKQAMICYRAALQIFTPQSYPVEWAGLHTRLASIYQEYVAENDESRDMNLRCAIVCYEGALLVYTPDSFLVEHAATLTSLAQLHCLRPLGDPQEHLEQAARCYRTALQVFTSNTFPVEYRQTLHSLAEVEAQRQQLQQPGQEKQPQPAGRLNANNRSYITQK